jgi:hypothetical protein
LSGRGFGDRSVELVEPSLGLTTSNSQRALNRSKSLIAVTASSSDFETQLLEGKRHVMRWQKQQEFGF